MEDKKKNVKLVCSICGQIILKNPSQSGKPYAVRLIEPIICDVCSHKLVEIDDENQSKLEIKNYSTFIRKSLENMPNEQKTVDETIKNPRDIKLMDIITNVKSVIKGQDEQVEVISTAIFKNQRIDKLEMKSNVIILGDSGSGKTEIIKILANEFKVPYVIEDATRFTEAGYFGASVDDMIKNLYKAAGDSIVKAQKGILIIDEGDKKKSATDIGRDVSGENVLFSLLKILEGSKVPVCDNNGDTMGYFDTSRLTIVFIGAFPDLAKIRDKRLKKTGTIGFCNQLVSSNNLSNEYVADDFIEGGFPKEFIGRFDMVVELSKLTVSNLEDIISNSEKSTFVKYIQEFEEKGLKLNYPKDIIIEIAEEAQKLNIGARGIKKVVQNMFKRIMFQILCDEAKYTECTINKLTVVDSTSYTLI